MFKQKMKKNLILKFLLVFGILIGLIGGFVPTDFASAENCPSSTTVSGTTVTFVGELTDLGGDETTTVWFEYGKTTAYGQKTAEKVLTQPGFYCITVSNLLPETTYNYRAAAKNEAGTGYGANMKFTTASGVGPTVELKADGVRGSIVIPYNTSANLTWSSSRADSCVASGAWSGSKSISGSQSTGNLTSTRTYTLTCTGPDGSASDSVTVGVETDLPADFTVRKTARNLSRGTAFADIIYAEPGDVLTIGITVRAGSDTLRDVVVKDTLPAGLIYREDLRIDNVLTSGNILAGLNIGTLSAGQQKTITFRADVASAGNFPFGQTELVNTASASSKNISRSDDARILVTRAAVAGIATKVPTGLTNNFFFDSLFLPLLLTLLIVWLLKSRILKLEEWIDLRKKQYQTYKSGKLLQLRIAQEKAKEFFQQRR